MDTSKIRFVVCDVDGTLTDGGMYITSEGVHFKRFHARDGLAVKMLQKSNYHVGLISHSKTTEMVEERARMLGIEHCYAGSDSKLSVLERWLAELDLSLEEVAYLGDDNNDREIMEAVGISVCPNDASETIRNISSIILRNNGGNACLREFVDEHLGIE